MAPPYRERHFKTSLKDRMGGILSKRPYAPAVVVVEVFFRKAMGERYFNGRTFFGGLIALIILRFFLSLTPYALTIGERVFDRVHLIDGVILLYGLLSLSHFIGQWRRRHRSGDPFRSQMSYSYFIGRSRFQFLGKALRLRDPAGFTYRFVEPLIVFIIAVMAIPISFLIALAVGMTAFRLFWENSRILALEWEEELDRRDGQILAKTQARQMRVSEGVELPPLPPAAPAKKRSNRLKSSHSKKSSSSAPSVEDALQNLDPQLRNLGRKSS